jgi:hypothetical protein
MEHLMGQDDDKPKPPNDSNDLLDELESIRGLLDDSIADDEHAGMDIPILDDIVPATESTLNSPTDLLDLQHIFDETESVASTDSNDATSLPLAGMALDNLELTEFGLEGLDLNDLDIDVEMPNFKLQAEILEPQHHEAEAADGATPDDSIDDVDSSLTDDLALLDDDPDLWLEDDPIADAVDTPAVAEGDQQQQEQLFDEPPVSAEPIEPPIDLDFLIQDIVDEFIPQIEDQLRRRLSACSATVIQQLAEKHLKK